MNKLTVINILIIFGFITSFGSDFSVRKEKDNAKLNKISFQNRNIENFNPDYNSLFKEIDEFRSENYYSDIKFTPIGPFYPSEDYDEPLYNGNGRINDIEINPNDSMNIWVGSASGGLWQSFDFGSTWEIIAGLDKFSMGIADIEFSAKNAGTVYVATGDPFSQMRYYSIGLLKSTDFGNTWSNVKTREQDELVQYNDIELIEEINIIVAASSKGLQVSYDNAESWSDYLIDLPIADIEVMRGNSIKIFVSTYDYYYGKSKIFMSKDSAKTFVPIREYDLVENIEISINELTQKIYAVSSDLYNHKLLDLVFSSNYGQSWEVIADSSDGLDLVLYQGFFNLLIESNPLDSNELFVGGVNLYKTTNHGKNWLLQNGMHVDHHDLLYTKKGVLNSNDGGIYLNQDKSNDWLNISRGLNISQVYSFSYHPLNPNIINIGLQDNGLQRYYYDRFTYVLVGDGMRSEYDQENYDRMMYLLPRGNVLEMINDVPKLISLPRSERRPWFGDIVYSNFQNKFFTGAINLYQSTDSPDVWEKLTEFTDTLEISALAMKSDTVLFAKQNILYEYSQMNSTKLFEFNKVINIVYYDSSQKRIILGMESYNNSESVYMIENNEVKNITLNLPNIPVNAIEIVSDSIIIGTDAGIYILTDSEWQYYSKDFPPVIVNEIRYNVDFQLLTASTFGRGIWQIDFSDCKIAEPIVSAASEIKCFQDTIEIEILNPNPEWEYTWWDGEKGTSRNYIFDKPGIHQLFAVAISNDSCFAASSSTDYLIYEEPKPEIFLLSNNPICEGDSAVLLVRKDTLFQDNYFWSNGNQLDTLIINQEGLYYNYYETPNGCIESSDSIFIVINSRPDKPFIYQDNLRLISSDAERYVWYRNLERIPNSNSKVLKIDSLGTYKVRVFNENNCWSESDHYLVDVISPSNDLIYEISPTIFYDSFNVEIYLQDESDLRIEIFDMMGKMIYNKQFKQVKNYFFDEIDMQKIAIGAYFVKIQANNITKITKIIKIQ